MKKKIRKTINLNELDKIFASPELSRKIKKNIMLPANKMIFVLTDGRTFTLSF
jgi:hypothetical protein